MDTLTLQSILEAFDAPLNEEQAWAVCFQCTDFLREKWKRDPNQCLRFKRINSIYLSKDGSVSSIGPTIIDENSEKVCSESELIQSIGIVVFQALDYGLSESEERLLSVPLQRLIERMTGCEVEHDSNGGSIGEREDDREDGGEDEGIGGDTGEEYMDNEEHRLTLDEVVQICSDHIDCDLEPAVHYKAVCRALVTEAKELLTFLDNITKDHRRLHADGSNDGAEEDEYGLSLGELQRTDWARLWMQLMNQLRHGVKLKKVDHQQLYHSVEYELTPYEILMEDIRSRRYNLQKVNTNNALPPRMKKNAHDVILDFIRSRPPLKSASERRLSLGPVRLPDAHEQLLTEIRSEPKLRPTAAGAAQHVVETSRTRLDDLSCSPAPTKKIIKPDLSLLMSNSFDSEGETSEEDTPPVAPLERAPIAACPFSPLTPLSPPLPDGGGGWHKTGPNNRPAQNNQLNQLNLQNSLACLSLTIEEVMHIRNVLTKAELETLLVEPNLYEQVAKGKVCFGCNKVKFSFFGQRATTCKFCQRNVCSRCSTKMRIPTEHFGNIPVYTLSPSPTSLEKAKQMNAYQKTGSAPSSPDLLHKPIPSPGTTISNGSTPTPTPTPTNQSSASSTTSPSHISKTQSILHKARALTSKATGGGGNEGGNNIQGPLMSICLDCKCMVVSIIRASRCTLANTTQPDVLKQQIFGSVPPNNAAAAFPNRDMKLDLQPVYK